MVTFIEQVYTAGNATGDSNSTRALGAEHVTAFLLVKTGTTPSITWSLQGSFDGTNWENVNAGTQVTTTFNYVHKPAEKTYRYYRIDVSGLSGSGVTFDGWLAGTGTGSSEALI